MRELGAKPTWQSRLGRLARIGTTSQSVVLGTYAWGLTVAPAAWSHGAPLLAKVAALVGLLSLVGAPVLVHARLSSLLTRMVSLWGLVSASCVVWLLVADAPNAMHLEGVRGVLGILGWGLFAFASAGPMVMIRDHAAEALVVASESPPLKGALGRGDGGFVAMGVVLALAIQCVGWEATSPARAVLGRLVAIVSSVAVIGGLTRLALARHTRRSAASVPLRVRRALPWVVMLLLFVVAGIGVGILR